MAETENSLSLEEKLKNVEALVFNNHKRTNEMQEKMEGFEKFLSDIQAIVDKQSKIVKELSESGVASSGVGDIAPQDLENAFKEFILNNKDITELISEVAKNSITFNYNKDKINKNIAKKRSKKFPVFVMLVLSALVLSIGFYFFKESNEKTITIPAGHKFYTFEKQQAVNFSSDVTITGKQDGNKIYFEIKGKKYFYNLVK